MASENSSTTARLQMDQRLDALDRALLGLLPRSERLAMVAQVESRVCEFVANQPEESGLTLNDVEPPAPRTVRSDARRQPRTSAQSLSRVALTAGVLGILALGLLVMSPVAYYLAAIAGEIADEMIALILLGGYTLAIAAGGLAAVFLGITALVRLRRRSRQQWGHGWAITGLCTGPLPMLAGGVIVLIYGLQLLILPFAQVQTISSNSPAEVTATYNANLPAVDVKSADVYGTQLCPAEPARLEAPPSIPTTNSYNPPPYQAESLPPPPNSTTPAPNSTPAPAAETPPEPTTGD